MASALGDNAEIFRITPGDGEKQLVVPYWALRPTEMLNFLCGKMDDRATTAILDKIFAAKSAIAQADSLPGVDLNSMTVDSPIPYSLRNLWLELIDPEVKTWLDQAKTQPAIVLPGDAATLRLPTYQPHTTTNTFALSEQHWCARHPQATRSHAVTHARSSVRVLAQARRLGA
jgi:hypothetical protein